MGRIFNRVCVRGSRRPPANDHPCRIIRDRLFSVSITQRKAKAVTSLDGFIRGRSLCRSFALGASAAAVPRVLFPQRERRFFRIGRPLDVETNVSHLDPLSFAECSRESRHRFR